jgi:acyl-CoA dehydrogenase
VFAVIRASTHLQAHSRVAFGGPLSDQGTVRADVAHSRIELEQARLLVLKTAHMIDVKGAKVC